jgi:hypothetical protein
MAVADRGSFLPPLRGEWSGPEFQWKTTADAHGRDDGHRSTAAGRAGNVVEQFKI